MIKNSLLLFIIIKINQLGMKKAITAFCVYTIWHTYTNLH